MCKNRELECEEELEKLHRLMTNQEMIIEESDMDKISRNLDEFVKYVLGISQEKPVLTTVINRYNQ